MSCPLRTGSPIRTATDCSRPLTFGTTSTVAEPMRLPTIMMRSLTDPVFALVSSTVIGGRANAPVPPGRPDPLVAVPPSAALPDRR